jgi:SAM-dependent methyltransferase
MATSHSLFARLGREEPPKVSPDRLASNLLLKKAFPHLERYPSKQRIYSTMERYTANLSGRTILDTNAGAGDRTLRYLKNGAEKVYALTSSRSEAAHLNSRLSQATYAPHRWDVQHGHLIKLPYADASIDCVIGYAVLHHVDAERALREIHRVLKPGGRLLMQEPMADNLLLKIFRIVTPHARTRSDAPLSLRKIRAIEATPGWRSESTYCGLVGMPVAVATSVVAPQSDHSKVMRLADRAERWLHRRHVLDGWNQYVALNLVKV